MASYKHYGKYWIAYNGFDDREPVVVQFRKVDFDADGKPSLKAHQAIAKKGYNRLIGTFKTLSEANDRIAAMQRK